ncbi:2,3-bisphosphoglycerate-independent phosphoglycerate mutase [Roseiflexus sp.]|uniref:2,3-bisphosphoglycerate-independent phosphoglycerate mutase n=1 Tax=Roseiflexus sp. TaxID=2562120 RepID=UPI001B1E902C|nr:2,3-bisphosphoglycerate-independent phosphoglycerate mutase [Roseiflexus sp.]MBO9322056.1 2,3-bisphosphoglycerate-independent phosphoglycerate mutase [Roseiflexus sp.]MCL6542483.1 2,3-bisphosphoglycerate-independent phosphoglycerate mutase [Roseiflexus sp.]
MSRPRPVLLVIRDGWGERDEIEGNGVKLARTPYDDRWRAECPFTLVRAAGKDVGLPTGQMGNSEVGHLNLGAGFIVRQDITVIDDSIADGTFFTNPVLCTAFRTVRDRGTALHLMGLLGPGGVHSHVNHTKALLELAKREGLERVYVHLFTDGRDTMPQSGIEFARDLLAFMAERQIGRVASVVGRYYAMDRDKRWERTKQAYDLLTKGVGRPAPDALTAIQRSYDEGVTDEFIKPAVIVDEAGQPVATIGDGDAVVCFNFRADRVRQISRAFTLPDFDGFEREMLRDLIYIAMTEYEKNMPYQVAFQNDDVAVPLAKVISDAGLRQFHAAETEKYPHVTFFFNGGREQPFPGEDWQIVPSPKDVPTYDLKPEMSAYGVRDVVLHAIASDQYDFILVNYANPDMVGHTGVIPAVVKACEVVDECTGAIVDAVVARGGVALVMADHGNAELMIDPETGGPHTAHTTNPVPTYLIAAPGLGLDKGQVALRDGGRLADVAPTILDLLGLDPAPQMTGKSLIVR